MALSTHIGQYVKNYLSENPDNLCQIDAGTGEEETKRSVLSRTIRLARSFRKYGLQPGDVIALGGKNHLDVHIPFYAGMMTGLPIAGVDPLFQLEEIKTFFKIVLPKVAFCEPEAYNIYEDAVKSLGLKTLIITFRGGKYPMEKFLQDYKDTTPEDQFQVTDFDLKKTFCWLVSTSGTSGTPKVAAISHQDVYNGLTFFLENAPAGELRTALNFSSMQWLSACFNALVIPAKHIKVQTSSPATPGHVAAMINKYKPRFMYTAPSLLARLLKEDCDFTCFDFITTGGAKVYKDVVDELRPRMKKGAKIVEGYGQTESVGAVLRPDETTPQGSCGKVMPAFQVKLVDPETGKTITEPYVNGEIYIKGPRLTEYYNNPKATAEAFTEDGFYRSGDLLYKDDKDNYFFVDRLKMLIKYKSYQIIPPEIEEVIFTHPGVVDVCVTSVEHVEDGERVVACVVRKPGADVTAQEVKDLVASKLSVYKHLHGGVVFLDELPLTSTGKVARNKVRQLVKTARIE